MTRQRSRPRSRRLGGRSPLTAVRESLPSLPPVGPSGSGSSLRRSYRSGLELSRDLLHLTLVVACIRFALTGAFVAVVSSKLLLVFAFNLLVTVPGMYRLALHLGWVEEPAVGIAVAPLLSAALGLVVGT
ncbi:hypothetical protein ACFQE1_19570, partial [Halobium palmae]